MPRVKVPVPIDTPEVAVAIPEKVVKSTPIPEPVQPLPDTSSEQGSPRFSSQQLVAASFGIILIVLLLFVVNLTHDRNQLASQVNKLSTTPAAAKNTEVKRLTDQIGQFYLLPAGETPTLATVTDIEKVRGQAFFRNARNGDKVLLYSKAGQAILYRPSIKKVINIAPVDLSNANPGSTAASTDGALPAPQP